MKNKIEQLKFKSRLTWRELAEKIGVQSNTLHLWKKGFVTQIKPENLCKLNACFKTWGIK